MKTKKNPKYNLEKHTRLFFMLGLCVSLYTVYYSLEHSTRPHVRSVAFTVQGLSISEEPDVMEVQVDEVKPKPLNRKEQVPVTVDDIEVVDDHDNVEESIIESTEVSETDAIQLQKIPESAKEIEEVEVEEEVKEDVPFRIIEQAPVYPGCSGNKSELKKCLERKIREHISREFDTDLAQELGLSPGIKRINVQFVIDAGGKVTDIRTRAPHKKLAKEAERVIRSLPLMEPGRQRGIPVRVKYNLPIVFEVLGE